MDNILYLFFLIMLIVTSFVSVTTEGFGDGLLYGWGRYYPDTARVFNLPLLERDGSGYSSSVGDNKDAYRIKTLARLENRIDSCNIQKYGNIFEQLIRPKPLYTTSLLARELEHG